MRSAKYVDEQIQKMKADGIPLTDAAWKAAKMTVGWPYVFAARGETCTPGHRRAHYSAAHPTIKSKCKNFDGHGTCVGCKWYPKSERVRIFDCRGYTYWLLLKIYGWTLKGAGATSQWNNKANWSAKGTIKDIPEDKLVCLFQQNSENKAKMTHTGLGFRGETYECQNGVQFFKTRSKKWTHWALPKCVNGDEPDPPAPDPPEPEPKKRPTIRKGSSGKYVKECQQLLIQHGYSCGEKGADGKFGKDTKAAVLKFQKDWELKQDGIVGPKTWKMLESAPIREG